MIKLGIIGDQSTDHSFLLNLVKMKDVAFNGIYTFERMPLPSGVKSNDSLLDLIENSDAILIWTKNGISIDMAKQIIRKSRHLFFKFIPDFSLAEMKELMSLEKEAGIITHLNNPLHSILEENKWNDSKGSRLVNLRTTFSENLNNASEILHLIVGCGLEFQSSHKRTDAFALKDKNEALVFNLRIEYENGTVCNMTITSCQSPTEVEIFERDQTNRIVTPHSFFAKESESRMINSVKEFVLRIKDKDKEKGSFEDLYQGKRLLMDTLDRLKFTDITF